jgi:hypothetical protein
VKEAADVLRLKVAGTVGVELSPKLFEGPHLFALDRSDLTVGLAVGVEGERERVRRRGIRQRESASGG